MNYYYITGTSSGLGKALAEIILEKPENAVFGICRKQNIEHPNYHHFSVDLNENLKNLQLRDQIKRDWTKNNNVPLLEIPYWDFNNIESILENFIKENYEQLLSSI